VDTSARAVAKPTQQDTRQQLQALLDQVGERIQPESRSLSFQVSEDINGVVVSVIDTETDELVRQIPAETMLRLAKALEQLDASTGNAGFLFTDTA
jgi:flagellar protein FlaG